MHEWSAIILISSVCHVEAFGAQEIALLCLNSIDSKKVDKYAILSIKKRMQGSKRKMTYYYDIFQALGG